MYNEFIALIVQGAFQLPLQLLKTPFARITQICRYIVRHVEIFIYVRLDNMDRHLERIYWAKSTVPKMMALVHLLSYLSVKILKDSNQTYTMLLVQGRNLAFSASGSQGIIFFLRWIQPGPERQKLPSNDYSHKDTNSVLY